MKVILLANVPGQGKKNDIIEVSDGYANNFLFKKGLATAASADKINVIKAQNEAEKRRKIHENEQAAALAASLNGVFVTLTAKKGESGKLFGSITADQIATALVKMGFNVDKKQILMDAPLRQVGQHKVSARLHPDVTATFTVVVE